MKRLVWLSVNSSYSHASLALPVLQLAAQSVQQIQWLDLEALTQDDPFLVATQLAQLQPDAVAASLYIFNSKTVLNVLARIKTILPQVLIMVGGPECLGDNAWYILRQCDAIDLAFSGEAEDSFPRILQAFAQGKPIPSAPDLARREDLQTQPQLIPGVYRAWATTTPPMNSAFFKTHKPFIQLETSRGCPFGCEYCTSARTVTRYKDLEHVRQELRMAQQAGVTEVRLLDRTFNSPEQRCVQLLRLFRDDFPDMRFHLEIHPQFLTETIRQELLKAKPRQLHVEAGIQSLHDQVLQAVGRPPHARQALDGLRFLVSCHPRFDAHCDLLSGLPEQDLPGLIQDLKVLVETHPAEIQLEVLKILPGTILQRKTEKLQIRYSPEPPYDVMATPHMTCLDILTARHLSRLVDFYYNHPVLQETFRTAHLENNRFIEELLELHTQRQDLDAITPSLDSRFHTLFQLFGQRYPEASFQLDRAWMTMANTPAKPNRPAQQAQLITDLPPQAKPVGGDPQRALETKGTRLWLLPHPSHPAVFALNRAIHPNRAAAEWTLQNS